MLQAKRHLQRAYMLNLSPNPQIGQFVLLCQSALFPVHHLEVVVGIRDKYDPAYRAIVDGLIAARKSRGLTQWDVAERMGTEQSQISKFERGERRLDILDYLRYCRAIGADPGLLLQAAVPDAG